MCSSDLLFLDEATSHLDNQLEQQITSAIANLQLTRVVIAHRQETIAASGRVIEIGKTQIKQTTFTAGAGIGPIQSS